MPELWAKSADGVNRKLRELWKKDPNNVNRKQKEVWAKDGVGVSRKIYSAAQVGDNYVFGGHNYKVVNVDASTGQAIIVCVDTLEKRPFNYYASQLNVWSSSALHDYLNSTFYNTFSAAEKAKIVPRTNYTYTQVHVSDPITEYVTTDYVWLLSMREVFGTYLNDYQLQWFAEHNTDAERFNLFSAAGIATQLRDGAYDSTEPKVYSLINSGVWRLWEVTDTTSIFSPAILINP